MVDGYHWFRFPGLSVCRLVSSSDVSRSSILLRANAARPASERQAAFATGKLAPSWSSCSDGHKQLPKIVHDVKFADGLSVIAKADRPPARNRPPPDASVHHQHLAIAGMDIILQTNSDNPFLAFRAVERFQDGSGYASQMVVRSDWIAVTYKFYFEEPALRSFMVGLEQLDRTLMGQARLKPMWEQQFLQFDGVGSGRVKVSGDLIEHSEPQQRVQFAFGTDQTCLRPFILSLKEALKG
jgi:hypothetical protein